MSKLIFHVMLGAMLVLSAAAWNTVAAQTQDMQGQAGQTDEQLEQPADRPMQGTQDQVGEPRFGEPRREPYAEGALNAREEAQNSVMQATTALKETMQDADEQIPMSVMQDAAGIVIIPDVVKAALIAGGRHGTGVMLSKQNNEWSPPVFVSVTGASLGAQVGVQSSDLFIVFRNQDNIQQMLQDGDFTIGVDASAAAGPAGATAKASTIEAEVLTYQRTGGLFAGVSLTGGVLSLDQEPLVAYYRLDEEPMRGYYPESDQAAQQILNPTQPEQAQRLTENLPESAQNLQQVLKQYVSGTQTGSQKQQ